MKLDRLSYLELVVHHVDASFYDFPSRCCYIRIPLEKIVFDRPSFCVPIDFSLGQIKKLNSIGFFKDPNLYLVDGHRPFDKKLIDWQFPDFEDKFRDACVKSYNAYSHYLDFIGSNYFENKVF